MTAKEKIDAAWEQYLDERAPLIANLPFSCPPDALAKVGEAWRRYKAVENALRAEALKEIKNDRG